jgi:hypothetical protein
MLPASRVSADRASQLEGEHPAGLLRDKLFSHEWLSFARFKNPKKIWAP